MEKLIIATRRSRLAQAQTCIVMNKIEKICDVKSEKLLIVTEGDRKLNVSLNKIGGKGLFVKDIERALLEGRAHGAVHSMKDMPHKLLDDFEIVAISERDDIRDAFISKDGSKFKELKSGAKIGTSSLRRALELKEVRNDIEIVPIRGSVETRISKMKSENLDGIVLAVSGLKRLKIEDVITEYFDSKVILPAIAQGALGIECLKNSEAREIFKKIEDSEARLTVEAERSFMRKLDGDCHSAIGVYSEVKGNDLYMIGTFEIGGKLIRKDILGNKCDNIILGEKLADKILKV